MHIPGSETDDARHSADTNAALARIYVSTARVSETDLVRGLIRVAIQSHEHVQFDSRQICGIFTLSDELPVSQARIRRRL